MLTFQLVSRISEDYPAGALLGGPWLTIRPQYQHLVGAKLDAKRLLRSEYSVLTAHSGGPLGRDLPCR
jgi:hypothetical protein